MISKDQLCIENILLKSLSDYVKRKGEIKLISSV